MEAECPPETMIHNFQIMKCHNPDDYNINLNPHGSLSLNIVRSNLIRRMRTAILVNPIRRSEQTFVICSVFTQGTECQVTNDGWLYGGD